MPVTAPYHFVPLSKWTCLPSWSANISHDQPFADGISGQLDIKINNHSPLLIGSNERDANVVNFIKDPTGQPYIPGSSLRGMLRNVLEIASFADMNFVDDARFGARDISNSKMNYATFYKKHNVVSGWLNFKDDWFFSEVENVEVKYDELDGINSKTDPITKYEEFSIEDEINFSTYDKEKKRNNKTVKITYAKLIDNKDKSTNNIKKGHIVFVGAMHNNDYKKCKVGDYIFFQPKENDKKTILKSEIVRDFEISHKLYGGEYKHKNIVLGKDKITLYEYLQKRQNSKYGIPVFALKDKGGNITALGLAKMMKIAVPNGIHNLLNQHKSIDQNNADEIKARRVDLVQAIFGMTRNAAGFSLKSRLSFSDAPIQGNYRELNDLNSTVLGGPKASYFPAYLEQTTDKNGRCRSYQDYFTHNAQLSGWKRYPVRDIKKLKLPPPPNENKNVAVHLKPLDTGACFNAKLRFHNLKKAELGAILWALSFGDQDNTYHSLGMGKPYGLGQITLKVKSQNHQTCSNESLSHQALITCFTDYMDEQYQQAFKEGHWSESAQIQNLLAMVTPVANTQEFDYMSLQEYTKSKNSKNALALLAFKGISRKAVQLRESGHQDNNYHFETETPYGKEQEEKFRQEAEDKQKEQDARIAKAKQEAKLAEKKANASETTQQVLDVIAQHKAEAGHSLDAICELIILEADPQAAKTFIDYINSDGKAWKAIKQKAKKQKRRAWLEQIQALV